MATINNTVYPPIVPTYQKAFIKNDNAKVLFNIEFDISEYTTITDVQTIEVKITTLDGNSSILKGNHFFKNAEDIVDTSTRKGNIEIKKDDVQSVDNQIDLTIGQFYIIQLRAGQAKYEGKNGEEYTDDQENFLMTNLDTFSEWSTMSMIKCIDKPVLTLMDNKISLTKTNRLTDMSDMIGYLTWENNDNSEFLYSYRFRVYDMDNIPNNYNIKEFNTIFNNVNPVEDSKELRPLTASPNRLHYVFKTDFEESKDSIKKYIMYITYETDNEYTKTEYFIFYIKSFIDSSNLAHAHAALAAFANNELGANEIKLTLDTSYLTVPSKYLIFRRSTSETDFKLWDDIHAVKITDEYKKVDEQTSQSWLEYNWIDWTAEDGVFYKYCVQEVDMTNNRAEKIIAINYRNKYDFYKSVFNYPATINEKELSDYLTLRFDDNYFINKDDTLKLACDVSISSVTKNRKDTITEALNSKYPFIYRSGKIEYDSYNIEGTITIEGDTYIKFNSIELKDSLSEYVTQEDRIKLNSEENIFANIQKLLKYDDIYALYQQCAEDYNLTVKNDFSIEKMFREKVEQFLCDGTPKLFKNAGLGNKIVMLTDVSLSPKETVGNRIYTLSATMTEIDDVTVDNYSFYNIIDLKTWLNEFTKDEDKVNIGDNFIGQYSYYPNQFKQEEIDIMTLIQEKYYSQINNRVKSIQSLQKIKIDVSELSLLTPENVLAIATINGKEFYISDNYPYLILDNVNITSFKLRVNRHEDAGDAIKIVIDFLTKMQSKVVYDTSGWIEDVNNYLGQIYKTYNDVDNNIYIDIYDKHYFKNSSLERKIKSVDKLLIQAYDDRELLNNLSDVAIAIKDMKPGIDEDDQRYVHYTDKNGVIDLYDEDRIIKEIVYQGIKIQPADDINNPKKNEYIEEDSNVYITEEELFKMVNPQENVLYKVGDLALAFTYNGTNFDYTATVDNDALNVTINTSNTDAANAIFAELDSGNIDLALTDDYTRYIYINGYFYKIDNNFIQYPVVLKVTYLVNYLNRKKVH